jgi:oxygen-independent coproporphyrinogen-3 oxidase
MPEIYRHQASIKDVDLPDIVEKNLIFADATYKLTANDYQLIGLDHFARAHDDLAIAKENNNLLRHFMGYTAGRTPHLIGIGPSSLSGFARYYAQNVYSLEEYNLALAENDFPILRGYELNDDDIIRRDVINNLLCYFKLDFKAIENKYQIDFRKYFNKELKSLEDFAKDGILDYSENSINITSLENLFTRQVGSIFDKYFSFSLGDENLKYTPAIQRNSK